MQGSLDCTGYVDLAVTVRALRAGPIDARVSLAPPPEVPAAALMGMGLGVKGGYLGDFPPAGPPRGGLVAWIDLDVLAPFAASL